MHIGLLRIRLHLPGNTSLKGKRQVVQSLKERVRQKTNVSIAEVDQLDSWQEAVLAIVTVSNEQARVHQVLDTVLRMADDLPDAVLTENQIEML